MRTRVASGSRRPSPSWPARRMRPTVADGRAGELVAVDQRPALGVAACTPSSPPRGLAVVGLRPTSRRRGAMSWAPVPSGTVMSDPPRGRARRRGSPVGDGSVVGSADDAPTSAASRLGAEPGVSPGRRVSGDGGRHEHGCHTRDDRRQRGACGSGGCRGRGSRRCRPVIVDRQTPLGGDPLDQLADIQPILQVLGGSLHGAGTLERSRRVIGEPERRGCAGAPTGRRSAPDRPEKACTTGVIAPFGRARSLRLRRTVGAIERCPSVSRL